MSPIELFREVSARCDHLTNIHLYLERNVTSVIQPNEILRAEWAARVSALDLYIHELVAQKMGDIFDQTRHTSKGYKKFILTIDALDRIRNSASLMDEKFAFDLFVRDQLSRKTFQFPDDIADAIRWCSDVELWNDIAFGICASHQEKHEKAKALKAQLSRIVERRNKIVHEGDLKPGTPREPWPITTQDLADVRDFLLMIVRSIDVLV